MKQYLHYTITKCIFLAVRFVKFVEIYATVYNSDNHQNVLFKHDSLCGSE